MSQRKHQIEAFFQQGTRLHAAGRLAEAERVYREVLAADPSHAEALHRLGVLALQVGQPAASVGCLDQAIRLRPREPMYRVNRANALLALHRPAEAESACREAIGLRRTCAEAHQVLGHALTDLGRAEEAVAAYTEAARHKRALPGLENDLGLALCEANRLDEAARHLEAAVRRDPADPQVRNNLAGVLRELGRLDAAEAMYRAAIRQAPDDPGLHVNLAIVLLLAGRLSDGWAEWEWRWRQRSEMALGLAQPRWEGEALNGRTLLVHAEQGIGSNIQFCRYVKLIASGGRPEGRIILAVQPSLVRLMAGLDGAAQVVALGERLPPAELRCPMLSLPRVLGTASVADIPAGVPYLRADPAAVARWRRRTEALPGLRVGLVWAGNPEGFPAWTGAAPCRSPAWRRLPRSRGSRWCRCRSARRRGSCPARRWPGRCATGRRSLATSRRRRR